MAPYRTVKGGQDVFIHPSSVMFSLTIGGGAPQDPKDIIMSGGRRSNSNGAGHESAVFKKVKRLPDCVVYSELLFTTRHYMRCITAIDSSWLTEVAPLLYKKTPSDLVKTQTKGFKK